jgi:hypothetical protein
MEEKKICTYNCDCQTSDDCNGEMALNLVELHDSDKSWKEDYSHENGQYVNKCFECGCFFMGHKRRVACKVCG